LTGALGRAGGLLLAPVTGALSLIRHARMFHPSGVLYRAEVAASDAPGDDAHARAGARLAGSALVRLSSAWWKEGERPDVLGIAIRFTAAEAPDEAPAPGDQDLLFATIRWPWATPLGPLTTRQHDFLGNVYYAVSPFEDDDLGRVRFRLQPPELDQAGPREERLARAVEDGQAVLRLQVASAGQSYRDLATIALRAPIELDQGALRFSPFRAGRGIRPVGFVHGLRHAAYAASRLTRPAHERP
jgi:hypothetical protein